MKFISKLLYQQPANARQLAKKDAAAYAIAEREIRQRAGAWQGRPNNPSAYLEVHPKDGRVYLIANGPIVEDIIKVVE